jgi:hypothetical protein
MVIRKKNENRISNKAYASERITNVEGRLAVHRLRFTILFPFRAFEISWFRDYLFWHLSFDIHWAFGL